MTNHKPGEYPRYSILTETELREAYRLGKWHNSEEYKRMMRGGPEYYSDRLVFGKPVKQWWILICLKIQAWWYNWPGYQL